MADDSAIPSVAMLHEALQENISDNHLLSDTDPQNISAIINVLHNHSFDLENKKLQKALDSLIEEILKSIK